MSHQVPLAWSNCRGLFNYFKPSILPEYDSLKQRSIYSEFEQLLLKIKVLSPLEESSNFETHLSGVKSFINGTLDQEPSSSASSDPIHQDLYYLLADYYFKNNETSKAMGFYEMDLCVQPRRFDSWAALALAYSKTLEDDLALLDKAPRTLATSTLRCFKRAMQLSEANSKLWIEYGSCTYMLQATASYLYKIHNHFFMPKIDFFETASTINPPAPEVASSLVCKLQSSPQDLLSFKQEMLALSKQCFEQAMKHDCDSEEEWLEHYMIGKMSEKEAQDPSVFLSHYAQVRNFQLF